MISVIKRVLTVTAAAVFVAAGLSTAPAAATSPNAVDAEEMAAICAFLAGEVHAGGQDSDYGCTIPEGQFRCAAATESCAYWPLPPVPEPLAKPCGRVSGVHAVLDNVATCSGDNGVVTVHCPPDSQNPGSPPSICNVIPIRNDPPKKPSEPATKP